MNLRTIAIETAKILAGFTIITFEVALTSSLFSGDSLNDALIYCKDDFFVKRKALRYLLIAIFLGIYRAWRLRDSQE
ncbi:hypothetical protein DSL64_25655 [Dyadobacter luteus]|uniref:Uncharacterized protein n=1 Tax=Dyadobacter luteus TaxID=2259619 RepID=A0A3D8Y3Z8_9BACT|nr:hypothetical protein DSL64_25655 [Dyadobacter luteus]